MIAIKPIVPINIQIGPTKLIPIIAVKKLNEDFFEKIFFKNADYFLKEFFTEEFLTNNSG